jgi:hypothetical protein
VIYQLLNKRQWLIDVFDYLDSKEGVELTFCRNLFDASNKYFLHCRAGDFCTF